MNKSMAPSTPQTVTQWSQTTPIVVRDYNPTPSVMSEVDIGFVVALVCFGIGGLLLLIGFIKVLIWYIDSRKHEKYSKWWLRQLEHRRHLEEYSIRTGDMASHYSGSVHSLANQGFTHEEEEEDGYRTEEEEFHQGPPVSPVATASQSAELSDRFNQYHKSEPIYNRQDKNMNEIMDYL